jgi:TPP-dependent pyruvate/acetoin dehydrogenase alpha subunit
MVKQGRSFFYAQAAGHEAAQIGSAWALKDHDWVIPYHRSSALSLVRGLSLFEFFADVLGTVASPTLARQMPNHFAKKDLRLVTRGSVVGNQIPQVVGTALGEKLRGTDSISIVYFGEGATAQGDFHVGMNFAGVYKTPSIFFCENNQYAISVPVSLQAAAEAISMEACGYEFAGHRVDGNDVIAVYMTTKQAVDKARAGGGPSLIEAVTYRHGSHSSSDDASRYRTADEETEWQRRDPIKRLHGFLRYKGYWSEEWEKELDERIASEIETAITEAEKQPVPEPETMFDDVYSEMPWHLKKQKEELTKHLEKHPKTSGH